MKQAPDAIYIITGTPERAEAIKQAIVLRGFDEIVCVPVNQAERLLVQNPPALAIIDADGQSDQILPLMASMPASVKSLVLVEQFDESVFVACHDAGARDFLVKPVPDAYLVSRIIKTLQEHRLEQISSQKDAILVEMGVLSLCSGIFTTSYLLKLLKQVADQSSQDEQDALSLVIVELGGYQSPLPDLYQQILMTQVGAILKECSRGLDSVGEYYMDKCAVILPQTGKRGATALGKRILERLNGLSVQGPNGPFLLEVRLGVADYTGCRHYEDLLNRALDSLKAEAGTRSGSLHQV